MKIGDISERLGIPASTIRYYESVGLIDRQARVSGRRQFDERALFTLRFVQLAQAAGFSIAETKSLLESYARDPSPGGMWKPFAEAKQAAISRQIETLQRMYGVLADLIACQCATLEDCVRLAESRFNAGEKGNDQHH